MYCWYSEGIPFTGLLERPTTWQYCERELWRKRKKKQEDRVSNSLIPYLMEEWVEEFLWKCALLGVGGSCFRRGHLGTTGLNREALSLQLY